MKPKNQRLVLGIAALVAVVGAGPAGLSCAHRLAMLGNDVVVYESHAKPGGLNEYGIAKYKLTGDFAQREVEFLLSIGGIEIQYGRVLGVNLHGVYHGVRAFVPRLIAQAGADSHPIAD